MRQAEIFYKDRPAGILTEDEHGYMFSYYEDYVKSNNPPVSLTLPLRESVYRNNTLFSFFDGLIPEGWLLDIAEKTWKLNPRDRMGLLLTCCNDCIGAVSVRAVPDGTNE